MYRFLKRIIKKITAYRKQKKINRLKQEKINTLWKEGKFDEIYKMSEKKRDELIEEYEYGPNNKTEAEYIAEKIINRLFDDFEEEEENKKIIFFKEENSNDLILRFKGLETFEDSEIKLSDLLKSINLSHIEIKDDKHKKYIDNFENNIEIHFHSHEKFKNEIEEYEKDKKGEILKSKLLNKGERIEELNDLSKETSNLLRSHIIALYLQTSSMYEDLCNIANGKSSPNNEHNKGDSLEGDKYLLATLFMIEDACKHNIINPPKPDDTARKHPLIRKLDHLIRFEVPRENPDVNLDLNKIINGGQILSTTLRNNHTYFTKKSNIILIFGNIKHRAFAEPISINKYCYSDDYGQANEVILPASTQLRVIATENIEIENKKPSLLESLFRKKNIEKKKLYIVDGSNILLEKPTLNISRRSMTKL